MGHRPRLPTSTLELKGAFKHNPARGRARAQEPVPKGPIGAPPDYLTPNQQACWKELVAAAHDGTLSSSDAPFMAYACQVWEAIKAGQGTNTKLGVRWESICGRLGMTPADRSRVSATRAKDRDQEDDFGEFAH